MTIIKNLVHKRKKLWQADLNKFIENLWTIIIAAETQFGNYRAFRKS